MAGDRAQTSRGTLHGAGGRGGTRATRCSGDPARAPGSRHAATRVSAEECPRPGWESLTATRPARPPSHLTPSFSERQVCAGPSEREHGKPRAPGCAGWRGRAPFLVTPPGSRCPAAPRRLQTGEGRRWPLRRGPRARPGELLPGHGGGGRGGSAVEAASPGAGRPRHHHRLGGSSATLLLNKVISSRCTMGTSRMTSVRPSWSRGKMTTLSAGRSAWKLNQRRSRQQAGGAPPRLWAPASPRLPG